MDTHLDTVFPLQLTLEDLIYDDHDGQQHWSQVVGLAADGDAVMVVCEGDPEPLRLPVSRPVRVRRRDASEHAGAPGQGEDVDFVADYYPGDLDSAMAAHAQPQLTPVRSRPGLSEPHYDGVYGGDLDHVIAALGGKSKDADRVALEARAAAFLRRMLAPEVEDVDEDAAAEDNDSVNERMAGWYAGDLGSIMPPRKDA
ncbi:MAG: hypothetical protein WCF36_07120 [Candidatus Nanopelagicales bacterium]